MKNYRRCCLSRGPASRLIADIRWNKITRYQEQQEQQAAEVADPLHQAGE